MFAFELQIRQQTQFLQCALREILSLIDDYDRAAAAGPGVFEVLFQAAELL